MEPNEQIPLPRRWALSLQWLALGLLLCAGRSHAATFQTIRTNGPASAAALGGRVAGVRHVVPSCSGDQHPVPIYRAKAMMVMESAEPATPIEAGSLALTGQVQVEFILAK